MRSLSRAAVVSAFALPLVFGGAGVAVAGGSDYEKCVDHSCWVKSWWSWKGDITKVNVINAGIINS